MTIDPDCPATGLDGAASVLFSTVVYEKLQLVARLMATDALLDVSAVTEPICAPVKVFVVSFATPVKAVPLPDAIVPSAGVVSVGLVSVLLVSVSVPVGVT